MVEVINSTTSLTWQQVKFIIHFLQTGNEMGASKFAGYDMKTQKEHKANGRKVLQDKEVQKELLPLAKQDALETIAKTEALVFHIIDTAKTEEVVKFSVELSKELDNIAQKYTGKTAKQLTSAYERDEMNIIKRIVLFKEEE